MGNFSVRGLSLRANTTKATKERSANHLRMWAPLLLISALLLTSAVQCSGKTEAKEKAAATAVAPSKASSATVVKQVPVPVQRLQLNVAKTQNGYVEGFLEYTGDDASKYRVCSSRSFFGQHAAELVCKEYGYPGGAARVDPSQALESSAFRQAGTLSTFTCEPEYKQLKECKSAPFRPNPACPATDIIYVRCYGEGSIRLVDGSQPWEGRLQIYLNGTWINACSKNFANKKNIETTCKLLGYPKKKGAKSEPKRVPSSNFDTERRRYNEPNAYLTYVGCTGNEDRLMSCTGGDAVMPDDRMACYSASEDAAFICTNKAFTRYAALMPLVLAAVAAVLTIVL